MPGWSQGQAEEGRSRWPSRPVTGASPDQQALGHPGLWPPSSIALLVQLVRPGPRPPRHPEARLPGAKWRWGRPCCQPRRTTKMLLLSPALIWQGLPGEGGPEAAAAARPRPPGIFERCSWVPGGWQTWQRRVGQTPRPTTRKGGPAKWERRRGQERPAIQRLAQGGRREPGLAQAARVAALRGRARPCSLAPCCRQPPWPGCSQVQEAWVRSGHRGHIVLTLGPAEGPTVASTRAVLPNSCLGLGPQSEPLLTNATGGCASMASSPGYGCKSVLGCNWPPDLGKPSPPRLRFPIHIENRDNGSYHSGC